MNTDFSLKNEEKIQLGRPRYRWEEIIKLILIDRV
jgi:hypothetical protein